LNKPENAPKIEKLTRKRYPDGFEAFGADALRFTLTIMAAQGRDVKLSIERVAGFDPQSAKLTINRWVLTELSKCVTEVTANIEKYRFNDAANAAYKFVWNTFCDWYLELLKPVFNGEDETAKAEAQACAGYVLDEFVMQNGRRFNLLMKALLMKLTGWLNS